MNDQPAELRDQLAALFRNPASHRPGDDTPGEIADLVLTVVQPKLDDLTERLDEMTRLRDNALRAATHADQSIHIDLEGILADGLHGQWGDDHAPEDLIQTIVGIVRPVVAHATKRAEEAEAANARVRQLCDLTINVSCRVQAIDQARDTLAVLDQTEASTTTCSRCNNNPADRESSLCESCDTEITAIREFVANLDPRKRTRDTTGQP